MGGKRTRLPRAQRDAGASDRDAGARDLVGRAQSALERCLTAAESAIATGQATPALLRESASIARAIVALEAEQRAARKLEMQHAHALEQHEWIAWFRLRPEAERARLLRQLHELDKPRSVLG